MVMLRAKRPEEQIDFITVGKKGDAAMRRIGQNIIATFELPDTIKLADTVRFQNNHRRFYKRRIRSDICRLHGLQISFGANSDSQTIASGTSR